MEDAGPQKWFVFRIKQVPWTVYRCSEEYVKALLSLLGEDTDKKVFGATVGSKHEIFVVSGHSRKETLDTLIHEILHASLYRRGPAVVDEDTEERIVSYCAPRLLDVLRSLKMHDLIAT